MSIDARRWQANLQAEIDGAALYRAMARSERNPSLSAVYEKLATAEDHHRQLWESKLREVGARSRSPRPSWRARLLEALTRVGGVSLVASTMSAREARGQYAYDAQAEAGAALPREERSHARILRKIATGGLNGPAIARLEGRHRASAGNALRAAVLGVNDGLVSNFGLVMGVAGAGAGPRAVLVAGLAGLLAGALSMALGEWLSVQSARELFGRQIAIEREELAAAPDEEEDELALIYQSRGMPEEEAKLMARQVIRSDGALDVLAREELLVDPQELGGSAYVAAGTSFAMFAIGALVPIIPLLFASGTTAIAASALVSAASLFGVGALITVITGQPAIRAGARQLAIGVAAAAITYGLGRLVGAALV